MTTATRKSKAEKAEDHDRALAYLRERIKPGATVYTVLVHRARSGMYRRIKVLLGPGAECEGISGRVADVLDWRWHEDGSVGVSGCGMDVGFHLVHCLSYALFPESFVCIGDHCPANDHANGDRDYTPHQHSKGAAGYALRHRWL
jgi:hypothetical protein